jgi:hypothetical protein
MGEAIGDVLPLAIGVALSPVPIIAIVLLLATPRARVNGPAFGAGWVIGLTLVGTVTLVLASSRAAQDSGAPATWASFLKLALGLLLLAIAARSWRSRPAQGAEAELPKWMLTIDAFGAGKAFGVGALLSGVNPKNLALTVAAATVIAGAGIPAGQEAGALAVFVAVGSLTILAPLGIYFLMGVRARGILDGLRLFMADHNAAIMTVLLLVFGVKLIGDAIAGLSS